MLIKTSGLTKEQEKQLIDSLEMKKYNGKGNLQIIEEVKIYKENNGYFGFVYTNSSGSGRWFKTQEEAYTSCLLQCIVTIQGYTSSLIHMVEKKEDINFIIINHHSYTISSVLESIKSYKGFGGREFIIKKYKSEEVITTTNLWHGMKIPESFYRLLPDNAEFLENSDFVPTRSNC